MGRAGLVQSRMGGFLANPAVSGRQGLSLWWDQPYGLAELTSKQVVALFPVQKLDFGASYGQSGDDNYSESRFSTSGSFHITSDIRAGLSSSLYHLSIGGLPSGQAGIVNLGVVVSLSSDLSAGAVWNNVLATKLSNYEDELPQSLAAGLLFQADDRTDVAIEIEQQPGWPMEVRAGVNTRLLKALIIRGGTRFNPAEYTAGFTLRHRVVELHYALLWHRDLGASHAAGLDVFLR